MSYLYEVAGAIPEPEAAWPRSERERRRLAATLLPLLRDGLQAVGRLADVRPPDAGQLLEDFFSVYCERPIADNRGGSGLNDSLWLYLVVRTISPSLIVESGTWRGHSAWLFRRACPNAEIHSFDLEVPAGGRHEEPDVSYRLQDWTESNLSLAPGARGLIFFDDHVSHARRLWEAAERGFRLALLDDNFPAHHLHATGAPPVPTLAMLTDPALSDGDVIEWQRNGKHYRYRDTAERRLAVLRRIESQATLPELAPVTRHPAGSGLTLVQLRS